jgi:hypothetical protein
MQIGKKVGIFSAFALLVALGVLFASCGGGGGGGGAAGGPAVDNSRASGVYSIIIMGGYGGEIGTVTFNGAGSATYVRTQPTSSGPQTLAYTALADNSFTVDSTLVGNLRNGGTFFVGTDVTAGNEVIVIGIKQSALASAPSNTYTYMSSYINYNSVTFSGIKSIVTSSPSAGSVSGTDILPTPSTPYTLTYSLNIASGTFSAPTSTPYLYGAFSSDKEIAIVGDMETSSTPEIQALLGLRLPVTGMSQASLNGTYILHEFWDDDVSGGGLFSTARSRLTFNGAGSGTYTELAVSWGPADPTAHPFTYTVNANGTFTLNGSGYQGVVLTDGSVFSLVDYDAADFNDLAIMVAVKQ